MFLAVTTQAMRIRIQPRHRFETDDLAYIPATLYVRRARAVAGLTAMSVLQGVLEVWSPLEFVRVQILMARLAGIAAHVLR